MSENIVIFPAREGDSGDEDEEKRAICVWLNSRCWETLDHLRTKHRSSYAKSIRAGLEYLRRGLELD